MSEAASQVVSKPRGADPVDLGRRIHTLDVLRGIALFGMILVHFHQRMRIEVGGVEDLIAWGVWILVEQKAHGTFAFLFGVGFAVLLRRLEARGDPVASIYLRRLAALALFGVVAQVGFGFQVLFGYAYWGVALLLIRRLSTRWLLAVAAASVSASSVVSAFLALHVGWTAASPSPLDAATGQMLARAVAEAAQSGSYSSLVAARWAAFAHSLPHNWGAVVPDMNLALFVLGILALRHGVLEDPRRHPRIITGAMIFGALSWAAWWVLSLVVAPRVPELFPPAIKWPLLGVFGLVQDQWLCLTYIGAVVLLLAYRSQWRARLALFGIAGRMALTNYMLQAMVLDVLASGYGFGLKLRPALYVVGALLLFGVELALSRAWLSRFRFGPLEWLWRSITYARWQPLRRQRSESLVPAAA